MPKYDFDPMPMGDTEKGGQRKKLDDMFAMDTSDAFNKKRDMCLGFLILTAVVYVLARAGGSSSQQCSSTFDIGAYREKVLSQTTPHIIECAEAGEGGSQEACHLSRDKRFAAVNQKGVTLWMTGLSGSGKSTIAALLEEQLVLHYGKSVYRLDGDNIRTGLNRDLGFSKADRGESVRRVGELSCLFNDAGLITIVSLVSPYKADREAVRKRHTDQKLHYLEVFMDVPLSVVQDRDPKGLYKKAAAGEIKGFTGIDDPYEIPEHPDILIKNEGLTIEASVDIIMRRLKKEGILVGGPTLPQGLPYPDGDELIDLHTPINDITKRIAEAKTLPTVLLSDIDVNWLQTVSEGWAAPLKGFMREGTLLQTLHFNSILVDPFNITGNKGITEQPTDFVNFGKVPPKRVSMSVPIVLPITDYTKMVFENSGNHKVALVNKFGTIVGMIHHPEIYANRKEEIVSRLFGAIDPGHPYISHMYSSGDWLMGGEIEAFGRIRYEDGLDQYRLSAIETMKAFEAKNADAVYAFQTRNPTHAGHAYLMRTARDLVKAKGYENPILWLSPLGGWTKSDDVPLDVRVKQHEAVINENMLDSATTVMAIWPAPMIYAGPTEVLFHAKSRRNAGATFFVAGRDPAGIKKSSLAEVDPDEDLYDGNHGRYVLHNSPGQYPLDILPFGQVYYDKRDHVMRAPDPSRPDDFISISGTKMRKLAAQGAKFCSTEGELPSDLLAANCIPPGFMAKSGWEIVCAYYMDETSDKWIPYSIMKGKAIIAKDALAQGEVGKPSFKVSLHSSSGTMSPWHDVNLYADEAKGTFNMVVEIPMHSTAKLEMNKGISGNPIMQDTNKDGSARYFTYGAPAFNYGLLPKTWEDSESANAAGLMGDNDPLDVVELGDDALPIGSIVAVKVLGAIELIDEGEIDYKIITIRESYPDADKIHSLRDLEKIKPGVVDELIHWFKYYKTSDGKPVNKLSRETPSSVDEALAIVKHVSEAYDALIRDPSRMSSLGLL